MSQTNSFNDGNKFKVNLNEKGFPLYELIYSYNFLQSLLNELQGQYGKEQNPSNETRDSSNIQRIRGNGDNSNFYMPNNKNENSRNASTRENPNEKEVVIMIENKPKFKTENTCKVNYFRFDYAKKYWKAKISKILTDFINKKMKNSDLPKRLKNKIFKPNSKLFTSNVKESDNYVFLQNDLRTIFTIGKKDNAYQKNNEDNISKIYEYFEKIGFNNLSDKMLEIKNCFEMTYEDFIKKFYESNDFINFKKEEKTIFYDEGTKKQEGFAISEYLGLIRLFRRKRNRNKES